MNWWDYAITAVSVLCTVVSFIGAYKSVVYYKKSKQLTIYSNTNLAFIESQKIIATLTEMLKLANITKKRGTNYIREVSHYGESIKSSIDKIRESLPVDDCKEINELLNSQQIKVDTYINSFITGTVLVNEKFVIDDDFNNCQQTFCDMQLLIKRKLENIADKVS